MDEYKVLPLYFGCIEIQNSLNDQAKQGWSLITIVHQPNASKDNSFNGYVAYFKKGVKTAQ